ncbi:hypothetical protein [Planococcus koreensis]
MRTLVDVGEDSTMLNETHGTPKERTDAFLLRYNSGLAQSCDSYSSAPY